MIVIINDKDNESSETGSSNRKSESSHEYQPCSVAEPLPGDEEDEDGILPHKEFLQEQSQRRRMRLALLILALILVLGGAVWKLLLYAPNTLPVATSVAATSTTTPDEIISESNNPVEEEKTTHKPPHKEKDPKSKHGGHTQTQDTDSDTKDDSNSALRGSTTTTTTPNEEEPPSSSEVLGKVLGGLKGVTFNDETLGIHKDTAEETDKDTTGKDNKNNHDDDEKEEAPKEVNQHKNHNNENNENNDDNNNNNNNENNKKKEFIDFAVAGFEKCGTTFLLKDIFNKSPQIFMAGGDDTTELHDLSSKELEELYETFEPHLNTKTEDGAPKLMGFKNPMLLANSEWVRNMQDNFPKTKLILTLRHPVLWFQSWYNYKLRTGHLDYPMPPPEDTIGLCRSACDHKGPEGKCMKATQAPGCSGHSNFHQYLSRLGLTPRDTEEELHLLEHTQMQVFSFPKTQVFLTEIGQMDGKNMTVSNGLIREMEGFLGLEENALPDIKPYKQQNYTWSEEKLAGQIDICDDQHIEIRAHLLDKGRKAGDWIEEYFLKSKQVHVHDRHDFLRRIRHWKVDPCLS